MSLEIAPFDAGHLLIGFDYIEYPERVKVGQKYPNYITLAKFREYIIVGKIIETGEDLVLPPEYAECTLGRRTEPRQRPPDDYENNPALQEILNGSASKES